MVIARLVARIRKKIIGLRGINARAIGGLLDDGQFAEDNPDQLIEALIQAIADSVHAIGCAAGHDEEGQASAEAGLGCLGAGRWNAEPGKRATSTS